MIRRTLTVASTTATFALAAAAPALACHQPSGTSTPGTTTQHAHREDAKYAYAGHHGRRRHHHGNRSATHASDQSQSGNAQQPSHCDH